MGTKGERRERKARTRRKMKVVGASIRLLARLVGKGRKSKQYQVDPIIRTAVRLK